MHLCLVCQNTARQGNGFPPGIKCATFTIWQVTFKFIKNRNSGKEETMSYLIKDTTEEERCLHPRRDGIAGYQHGLQHTVCEGRHGTGAAVVLPDVRSRKPVLDVKRCSRSCCFRALLRFVSFLFIGVRIFAPARLNSQNPAIIGVSILPKNKRILNLRSALTPKIGNFSLLAFIFHAFIN